MKISYQSSRGPKTLSSLLLSIYSWKTKIGLNSKYKLICSTPVVISLIAQDTVKRRLSTSAKEEDLQAASLALAKEKERGAESKDKQKENGAVKAKSDLRRDSKSELAQARRGSEALPEPIRYLRERVRLSFSVD